MYSYLRYVYIVVKLVKKFFIYKFLIVHLQTVGKEQEVFEGGEIEGKDFGGKRKRGYKTDTDASVSRYISVNWCCSPYDVRI